MLIKGADWLVVGSSAIAKKYNVSDLVIGLTIVSMGTSMPELIVNILASVSGSADIALGNVVGSNITNILLILGVAAVIYPLTIKNSTIISEIPYSIIALLLVAFAANSSVYNTNNTLLISREDGAVFLLFFGLFMAYIVKLTREGRSDLLDDAPSEVLPFSKSIFFVVLGIIGLFLGGKWVVDGGVLIAHQFGMSQKLIGLTVIALGTSLPELVTSAMAAYRKNTDIAVANVIGSNIFNLLWVLGISVLIKPMPFDEAINTDFVVLLLATCLIIFSLMIAKTKNKIGKSTGIFFLLCYVAYTAFLVWRG